MAGSVSGPLTGVTLSASAETAKLRWGSLNRSVRHRHNSGPGKQAHGLPPGSEARSMYVGTLVGLVHRVNCR